MAGLHRKEGKTKYLVLRRDGTVPDWEWFVLGAKDPWAPAGIRAYALEAEKGGADPEYVHDLFVMATEFAQYRHREGAGDPDAPLHRTDNPWVAAVLARTARVLPGVAVVKVDVEQLHRVAVEVLRMTDPAQIAGWVQGQFEKVIEYLSSIKPDDFIVDGDNAVRTVHIDGRQYDVELLHVLVPKEDADGDAD